MTNEALVAQIARQHQMIVIGQLILTVAVGILASSLWQVFFNQHGALYYVISFGLCLVTTAAGIYCWIKGSVNLKRLTQQSSRAQSV